MNTPFKKRSDPFAEPTPVERKVEPVVEEQPVERVVEKPIERPVVRETVVVEKKQPVKVVTKPAEDEGDREKYTATMEKNLRRRIKVASALTGIQVSTFIEQACLEKLEREGK